MFFLMNEWFSEFPELLCELLALFRRHKVSAVSFVSHNNNKGNNDIDSYMMRIQISTMHFAIWSTECIQSCSQVTYKYNLKTTISTQIQIYSHIDTHSGRWQRFKCPWTPWVRLKHAHLSCIRPSNGMLNMKENIMVF